MKHEPKRKRRSYFVTNIGQIKIFIERKIFWSLIKKKKMKVA